MTDNRTNPLAARRANGPQGPGKIGEAQMLAYIDAYNEGEHRNNTDYRWMLCGESPNRFPKRFSFAELREMQTGNKLAA